MSYPNHVALWIHAATLAGTITERERSHTNTANTRANGAVAATTGTTWYTSGYSVHYYNGIYRTTTIVHYLRERHADIHRKVGDHRGTAAGLRRRDDDDRIV